MTTDTTIDLLRHGQPLGGERVRGHTNDLLSEVGWHQMRSHLQVPPAWERVITSPLLRCAEFATEVAGQSSLPLALNAGLKEIHFGAWEGRSTVDLLHECPEQLQNFWRDPMHHHPPGGETLQSFQDRVLTAWQGLIDEHSGEHLLVVTHGGVIRVVLMHALGMPMDGMHRIEVPYGGLSRVVVSRYQDQMFPRLAFHARLGRDA